MTVTAGRGLGSATGGRGGRLRREVIIPLPTYRRASALIGMSLVLVLVASAVDALVWTYQSQRALWRQEAVGSMRPSFTRHHAVERAAQASSAQQGAAAEEVSAADHPRPSCRFHLARD